MSNVRFPIEAGHILLFARELGDENPIYHDTNYAETTEVRDVIAPPTFERAVRQFDPNDQLRPRVGEPWIGSGREPTGKPVTGKSPSIGLHAEQRYEYYKLIRPGDVLTAKSRPGETWEREGRRAGKLTFNETITEYYDEESELVMVATAVSVHTERVIE